MPSLLRSPAVGVQGGDYWAQQGETFVSAYMAVAGLSVRLNPGADGAAREPLTIQTVTAWAFRGAGITDPTINELVRSGLESADLETRMLAQAAALKLTALHQEDPRIRASIYATGRMAFEAWSEPSVAHSASVAARDFYSSDELWVHRPRFVDLDWLVGDDNDRANTLYLIAPDTEFKRLAPVLGGLLGDFREQLHAWDIQGRRLSKPLLVVIDEAAQLELAWLPEEGVDHRRARRHVRHLLAVQSPDRSPLRHPGRRACSAGTVPRSCSPVSTTPPPSTGCQRWPGPSTSPPLLVRRHHRRAPHHLRRQPTRGPAEPSRRPSDGAR